MNTTHFLRAMIAILSLAVAVPATAQCTGDLTGNGIVDGADLGTILAYWGPRTQDPSSIASDLNGDGLIDGADLGALLASWGPCQSTITGVAPNQGCIVGGTQITITGTYLGSTSVVTVDGTPATNVTVVSQNTVQATTPAGAAGPSNVRVTTAAGMITASQQFTYMPASVSSIVPNIGPASGGTSITIVGAYLGLTTSVMIGGTPSASITVVDANTLRVVTPSGTLGSADVVISGSKGVITISGGYQYVPIVVPNWATLIEAQPDPSIVTAPALRAAIMATGLAWRIKDSGSQIEMLLVPPGSFQMGFSAWSSCCLCGNVDYEIPVHGVTLTKPVYLGRYEVTQAQWTSKVGTNPSFFQGPGYPDASIRPVEQVSWNAVQTFIAATGLRLPTEAEWEYTYRAGTTTAFHSMPGYPDGFSDEALLGTIAWCPANSNGQTHPVGLRAPNSLGFHDLSGNVSEWISDWYSRYSADDQVDPVGSPTGQYRAFRGGSWDGPHPCSLRSSARDASPPTYGDRTYGFRVARNP